MNYYILTFNVSRANGENEHVLYGVITSNTDPGLTKAKEAIAAHFTAQNNPATDIAFVSLVKVSPVIFEQEQSTFLLLSKP